MNTVIDQVEQIAQQLRDFITQEIAYDQSNLVLANDLPLVEKGIIDSMAIMRLINFLEEEFAIDLEPDELKIDNFVTIDAITQFIIRKR